MKQVKLHDKTFAISMPEEEILKAIDITAERMVADLDGKHPLFVVILNGAFMFASDLMKRVEIQADMTFIKVASYEGTESSGKIKEILGMTENVKDRTVVIIEDIVDSGFTMNSIVQQLNNQGAAEIHIATLFYKPEANKYNLPLTYVVKEIPNDFIVGYGLDYDGLGRNMKDIYTLVEK